MTFTPLCRSPYTALVIIFGSIFGNFARLLLVAAAGGLVVASLLPHPAQNKVQETLGKDTGGEQEKNQAKTPGKLPAQIELLETHVRVDANGDSRKEVHALVRINDELGARQFGRLNFNYNRAFQVVEIPLAHITHANGGTSDVLPSAITDNPDPAVANFPAYQDVRVKSVRILGLAPENTFEYRVVTTTSHHPLAPDFWFDHSFDRSGVVVKEEFQVTLPASEMARVPIVVVKDETVRKQLQGRLYPEPGCGLCGKPDLRAPIPASQLRLPDAQQKSSGAQLAHSTSAPPPESLPPFEKGKIQLLLRASVANPAVSKSGDGGNAVASYTWRRSAAEGELATGNDASVLEGVPDIEIGRDQQWPELSYQLFKALALPSPLPDEVRKLSQQLTAAAEKPMGKIENIYDFVSQKIKTVDLPLGATGFRPRLPAAIISSGYGTQEDKFVLFLALTKAANLDAAAALVGATKRITALMAAPGAFTHLLVYNSACNCWLDPALEVAPFGLIPASYRGASALVLGVDNGPIVDRPVSSMIEEIFSGLPYASKQKVIIDGTLDAEGQLTAKAQYVMRGDNELLLRVAFHQSPKEKWNEVAQLLALSDGFRGKIIHVSASDPYETKKAFTVEYEIAQPKFLDWSKKPLRIPALLPLLGLPEPATKPTAATPALPIDMGTPLEVEVAAALHLPQGTGAEAPAGTSVERDFATYSSLYAMNNGTLTASRHINFIWQRIPADRAAEYNAFLHAVQNDEMQVFMLHRAEADDSKPKPGKP